MEKRKVVIVGAAGRDFHNFNVVFRDDPSTQVVAFTAAQIPDIDGRVYPAALAGEHYPEGIPIVAEESLESVLREHDVDEVVFSYSDVSHEAVMHLASRALAAGADYRLLGPKATEIVSSKPVVSICAVRTGCGKSQTTRRVASFLHEQGLRVVAIRHPMPYGDLAAQRVQRFAELSDLDEHECTIEEREEYEPHITTGTIIYAGVDYEAILREAEKEADVILWDGGNNDLPFYKADVEIVVADPHRPGHELSYHPGEANARKAHVVIINKVDTADAEATETVRENVTAMNPDATIILGESPTTLEKDADLSGKKVLVVEDGPTLTHGGMRFGAGVVAAKAAGAAEILDPRPWATRSIAETFDKYPDTGAVLPAMGYSAQQVADLQETIDKAGETVDAFVIGTPIDLRRLVTFPKPAYRVTYDLEERGEPTVADVLRPIVDKAKAR
jgi:predicted GTPase